MSVLSSLNIVLIKDSLELLGYILGLLSFVISWTSRFPSLLAVVSDPEIRPIGKHLLCVTLAPVVCIKKVTVVTELQN